MPSRKNYVYNSNLFCKKGSCVATLSCVSPWIFLHGFILFLFPSFIDTSGNYHRDSKAFLFSLVNNPEWAPLKLPQTGESNNSRDSIRCHSGLGPTFGGGYDICIYNNARSNSNSYSNLGYTYSSPSGYSYGSTFAQTFLAGTHRFTPDEVETFYETTWT